ncbi:MAG: MBL fold metallo-hydrolase [Ardenticatenales bacterium]|nr:MBL fold metallo-hydrolase [Ardenticatenales bacterium]
MAHRYGPISSHHMIAWMECESALVTVDTGWDVAIGESYLDSDLEALVQASLTSEKPVSHVLLTHNHRDHRLNLPFLLEHWPDLQLCAHPAGNVEGIAMPLQGGETLVIGGQTIQALHTPGHSQERDELSFYLPEHRFLFCGDALQPQGPSYAYSNGPSPVPYFHYGDEYQRTLERLIALDPLHILTGHGSFLASEQGKQWLRVTLTTIMRIDELAMELVERYPDKGAEWHAESVYDQIADERHYGLRAATQRKRQSTYPGETDYERFDRPGILDAVRRAQQIF